MFRYIKQHSINIINIFLVAFIFFSLIQTATSGSIESLLEEYTQEADLSSQTKKESAGYLIVFTRADLDRMRIKSLKELINKIPFLRYNENSLGFSDINYWPYQKDTFNPLIIYINDREILAPFSGNGFQLLGQLDMDYIDHIEIYLGLPSYEIGFATAATVIKAYTKKGYRENTNVFGSMYGTYGTNDQYFYQAKTVNGASYLIYTNHRNLKRKKFYNKGFVLSKDKRTFDFYSEINTNNIRIENQFVTGSMNDFIGKSWEITPTRNKTKFSYMYGGIYYTSNDKTLRISASFSQIISQNTQASESPLGMFTIPTKTPPYFKIHTYNSLQNKIKEKLGNIEIMKKITDKKNSLILGIQARYKKFVFEKLRADNVELPKSNYNMENILSAYFEDRYSINPKNMLVYSMKTERYFENGNIKNMSTYSGRLGYIRNENPFFFKTFLFFGGFAPQPYILYHQNMLSSKPINQQKAVCLSGEITYKKNSSTYSLLLVRTYYKDAIYFTGKEYENSKYKQKINSISFRYRYNFNPFNKLELNAWMYHIHSNEPNANLDSNHYGGYIALFNKIGNFDLYNSLSYRKGFGGSDTAFNLNSTVTYQASRDFLIYLKGENLLNKAITTTYYRINPITKKITTLNKLPVFDRTVWLGVEYKF